jgi:transcriptional regulator with XRE-family HTH domain
MEKKKMAQGVKELRKRKGLSQEELSKNSGLSLRTIQRVENGETEPTGETLKRISTALDTTPNELIDWGTNKETIKKTVKTKYEYLHIFDSKLIINKTQESNLTKDNKESVSNVFKTLTVFIIFILIFAILAFVFYNMGKMELVIHTGAYSFLFLNLAFFSMLFFSFGSSLIKLEDIHKIKIQRILFINRVVILHKESGQLKKRYLIFEKNQIGTVKDILLSEKLIKEKDIQLEEKRIHYFVFVLTFIIFFTPYSLIWKNGSNNVPEWMTSNGTSAIILSFVLIILMIRKLLQPLFYRNNKPLTKCHM